MHFSIGATLSQLCKNCNSAFLNHHKSLFYDYQTFIHLEAKAYSLTQVCWYQKSGKKEKFLRCKEPIPYRAQTLLIHKGCIN